MLVVMGLLAVVEPGCIKGRGWEIAIFLVGAPFDSIMLCFASAGLLSLLGGTGQDLVINRFADAGKAEGHGAVALLGWTSWAGLQLQLWVPGLLIPWVVLRVSQLPLIYIACLFAEICFSSLFFFFFLRHCSWGFLPFGLTACQAFWGMQDWGGEVQSPGPLALGRSSTLLVKDG